VCQYATVYEEGNFDIGSGSVAYYMLQYCTVRHVNVIFPYIFLMRWSYCTKIVNKIVMILILF